MNPPPVHRGAAALHRVLLDRTLDVRALGAPGFREWLHRQLERWQRDPRWTLRRQVRDLRIAHPDVARLERALRDAEAAERGSGAFARLETLERELRGLTQALAGLSAAEADAAGDRRAELAAKRQRFAERQAHARREHEEYTRRSPERQAVLRLRGELEAGRAGAGLSEAEGRLREQERSSGRGATRRGGEFERRVLDVVLERLMPELAAGLHTGGELEVLQGVRLGAAGVEIDQLVVRVPDDPGAAVEALILVEAKRDPNDLAHGFLRRQWDLAWLSGDRALYDPAEYRNRHFPTGHFDRAAEHRQGGRTFQFQARSFTALEPGPRGVFLVTRLGRLWGMDGAALARVAHRAACDPAWDPDDAAYREALREWCVGLAGRVEAPDVLRRYAADAVAADRLLLLEA